MSDTTTQTAKKTVALVGHCGPDSSFLRMAVSGTVPGAKIVMINNDAELEAAVEAGTDLLMFNRVLEVGFKDDDGVALLREVKLRRPEQKVMMISNYPETQQEAEEAGAVPGFGKREIGSAKAKERLAAALGD